MTKTTSLSVAGPRSPYPIVVMVVNDQYIESMYSRTGRMQVGHTTHPSCKYHASPSRSAQRGWRAVGGVDIILQLSSSAVTRCT